MNERLLNRDVGDDPRAAVESGSPPTAPRWIRRIAIAVGILVVLTLVALHLTGAIGPGVH